MSNSVTVSIKYTKEQLDREFIETGVKRNIFAPDNRELNIDEMTTEQRADLLVINWSSTRFGGISINHYKLDKERRTGKPMVAPGENITFDHVPTDEEILTLMSELADEKRVIQAEVAELLPAWRESNANRKAEEEAERKAKDIRDEEREERKSEERKQKQLEAVTIHWSNGTALFDLGHGLSVASGLTYDHRWNSWTKEITGIDRSQKNGYMYEGDFINSGTVELDQSERRVFLVAATTGSNKYRTTFYQIVELVDGKLVTHNDLRDDDDKPGWALRMRDGIAELLGNMPTVETTVNISLKLAQRVMVALSLNDQELADEISLHIK